MHWFAKEIEEIPFRFLEIVTFQRKLFISNENVVVRRVLFTTVIFRVSSQ